MSNCPNCNKKIGIFNFGIKFCSFECKNEYKNKPLSGKLETQSSNNSKKQTKIEQELIDSLSPDLDSLLEYLEEIKVFLNSINLNERDYSKYNEQEIKSIFISFFHAHKIFGWLGADAMLSFSYHELREKLEKVVNEFSQENIPHRIYTILDILEGLKNTIGELGNKIKRVLEEIYNIDVSKKTSSSISGLLFSFKPEENIKKYEELLEEDNFEKLSRLRILLFTIKPNVIGGLKTIETLENLIGKMIKKYQLKKTITLN